MHSKAPSRFKFSLKDDLDFNFEIIIDVLYLNGKPVIHIVDTATAFQAARFFKDMSANTTREALKLCWIDTYLRPPEYIVHDASKNFISSKFKQNAKSLSIEVKEVPVEAHNSVGKVERYHALLQRAFKIIHANLPEKTTPEAVLQMVVKAVNDNAEPNGLVPTLLVFGAYSRMSNNSLPLPTITQRAEAVRKAINKVCCLHAERQVKDALAMRNGPNILETLDLPLNSDVRVWREKENWTKSFKLISTNRETCMVQMPHGPTNFRATMVKPYYTYENSPLPASKDTISSEENRNDQEKKFDSERDADWQSEPSPPQSPTRCKSDRPKRSRNKPPQSPTRCGCGRPKGSKNKPKSTSHIFDKDEKKDFDDCFVAALTDETKITMAFMANREEVDWLLALKLWQKQKITTSGGLFELSDKKEIDTLIGNSVFRFEQFDAATHGNTRIFKSRLVREIKGKATDCSYEKSRLVIQGYLDKSKAAILTQSPTIQQASQQTILALAPSLMKLSNRKISLWLRDITQTYVQSQTKLKYTVLAYLSKEIAYLYPDDTIMVVVKPLYGLAEAGTHWWATYSSHYKIKLGIETSTYDPCFLITMTKDSFGIVSMQTDDAIILANTRFSELEEQELVFFAKPKEKLTLESPLIFNGCILSMDGEKLLLQQKKQGKRIELIDAKVPDFKQRYIEQRAKGAYVASFCQPEATFDLSVAAQTQEPSAEEIATLNKRLQWQLDHLDRMSGLAPMGTWLQHSCKPGAGYADTR